MPHAVLLLHVQTAAHVHAHEWGLLVLAGSALVLAIHWLLGRASGR
jgi:hypothetical protein